MNDFIVMIQTALETKGIKTDYNEMKKWLEKNPAKINTIMDVSATKTEVSKFIKEFAPQLQKMFSDLGVKVDLKDIETSMKSVFKESEKAAKQYQKEIQKMGLSELSAHQTNEKLKQDAIKQTAKIQQDALSLDTSKLNTASNIDAFLARNTKMTKELRAEFLRLKASLDSVDDSKSLSNVNKELGTLKNNAKATGQVGMSMGDNFKEAFGKFSVWVSASAIFFGVQRVIKNMVSEVKNIDSAMISLKKVSESTDTTYDRFLTNASQKAKELGSSISDLVNATADFARLGYNLPDAEKLGEVAVLYKNVGDGINIQESSSSIISTMKAFNIEAENSITIVDKFNEVGNRFAISSAGIGEALQKSASGLVAAGNTIDEAIALIVSANNVVQNPETVGQMWKTVSMRIRGAKTELEEAGLEIDGMAKSTSELREELKSLTGFDIMTDDNTFKSTYDIVLGISEVFDKLSDTLRANVLELLAGKRQGNALAAALNNAEDLVKTLEVSQQSMGSAMREQEKYQEGIQYSLDRLKASMQELSLKTLDDSIIKLFIDLANGAINTTTAVGGLVPVLVTVGVVAGVTKIAMESLLLSTEKKTVANLAATVSEYGLATSIKATGTAIKSFMLTNPVGWILALGTAVFGVVKIYDALTTSLEEQQEKLEKANDAYKDSKSKLESINSELNTAAQRIDELNAKDNLTFVEQGELENLQEITKELLIQQDIQRKKNQANAKALAETASDTFKKQFGNSDISENKISELSEYVNNSNVASNNASFNLVSDTNDISAMIAGYKQFIKLQDEALGSGATEDYEHFKGFTEDISNSLWDNVSVLQEQQSNMKDYYNIIKDTPYKQLTTEQQEVYDNYDLISDAIELIYKNLDPSKLKEMNFNEVFNSSEMSKVKSELEEMAKAGQLTPEVLSSTKEYEQLLLDTGLTAEECANQINALVGASSDLGGIDVIPLKSYKEIIDDLSGKVKLVTEAQLELAKSGVLGYDTVSNLLAIYPELEKSLTATAGGFKVTKKALDDLITSETTHYQLEFDNAVKAAEEVFGTEFTKQEGYDGTAKSLRGLAQAKLDDARATLTQARADYTALGIGGGGLKDFKPYNTMLSQIKDLEAALNNVNIAENNINRVKTIISQVKKDTTNTTTNTGKGKKSINEVFDWIAIRIEKLREKSQKTIDKIANYISYKTKNKQIDIAIKAKINEQDLLKDLQNKYNSAAKKIKLPKKYQNLVNSGGLNIENVKDETLVKKINEYTKWKKAADEVGKSINEINKEIKELSSQKLDNISSYFDIRQGYVDSKISQTQSQIDLRENRGLAVRKKDYDKLIDLQAKSLKYTNDEYIAYKKQFDLDVKSGKIKEYSEAWYDALIHLSNINKTANQTKIEINGIIDNSTLTKLDKFNKSIEKIDSVLSEIDFTSGIVEKDSIEQIALFQSGFSEAKKKSEELTSAIKKLKKEYKSKDSQLSKGAYEEELSRLEQAQRTNAQAMQGYQNNIVSAMRSRYDKQLSLDKDALDLELKNIEKLKKAKIDALNEELDKYKKIIDERKKALIDEQKADDYNMEVEDAIKEITKLEDRVGLLREAELTGDREAGKERREAEEELAKKRNELTKKQRDREVDLMTDSLDEESKKYEELKKQQIKDSEYLYDKSMDDLKEEYDKKEIKLKDLYETENNLIKLASQLTRDEADATFEHIQKLMKEAYNIQVSYGLGSAIGTSNNTGQKPTTPPAVKSYTDILGKSTKANKSQDKTGISNLNKFLVDEGYGIISQKKMIDLAKSLGLNNVTVTDSSKEGKANKELILSELKKRMGKFANTGMVKATKGGLSSIGEDGIVAVRDKEIILDRYDSATFRDFVPLMKDLMQEFKAPKLNTIDNNSSPITLEMNFNGSVDKNTVSQLRNASNDIVGKLVKEIKKR